MCPAVHYLGFGPKREGFGMDLVNFETGASILAGTGALESSTSTMVTGVKETVSSDIAILGV